MPLGGGGGVQIISGGGGVRTPPPPPPPYLMAISYSPANLGKKERLLMINSYLGILSH